MPISKTKSLELAARVSLCEPLYRQGLTVKESAEALGISLGRADYCFAVLARRSKTGRRSDRLPHCKPGENWRPVVGIEDLYLVSDLGRIWSRRRGGPLKMLRDNRGYMAVTFCAHGRSQRRLVHHVVAEAFIGMAPGPIGTSIGTWQINHRDGDKVNNSPLNLEWCDGAHNTRHASLTGLLPHGEKASNAKLTETQVFAIKDLVSRGESQGHVARMFGIHQCNVSRIASGKRWMYLNDRAA